MATGYRDKDTLLGKHGRIASENYMNKSSLSQIGPSVKLSQGSRILIAAEDLGQIGLVPTGLEMFAAEDAQGDWRTVQPISAVWKPRLRGCIDVAALSSRPESAASWCVRRGRSTKEKRAEG